MTRRMAVCFALVLSVIGVGAVYAGMGCNGCGSMFGDNPDIEKVRLFQKETSAQRDEMMIKRLELKQELGKKSPDKSRVETLRKEMIELRTKIQGSADTVGLAGGCMTECNMDPVDCAKDGSCDKCGKKSKKSKKSKQPAGCKNCNMKK